MRGKTIRIFLVNGSAKGLRTAEIGNWTGKALVCPRSDLSELAKRDEASASGVYFLVGQDPDEPRRKRVYVGESGDVRRRLVEEHDKDSSQDFWEDTIAFVSKDENLTKAHILYLEWKLIQRVKSVGKATSKNVQGKRKSLPEADVAEMEYYLEQVEILLPALGYDFLEPEPNTANSVGPEFFFSLPKEDAARATAVELEGLFVVKEGSRARTDEVDSLTATYRDLRTDLLAGGQLAADSSGTLRFTTDVSFKSPSAAACVVAGSQTNGREKWTTEDGTGYGLWRAQQLKATASQEH